MSAPYEKLQDAVRSGKGFHSAADTEEVSRWALAEINRLRTLVDSAHPCVVEAFNQPSHSWHASDLARKWMMEKAALDRGKTQEGESGR
jgi:hypothetical protein